MRTVITAMCLSFLLGLLYPNWNGLWLQFRWQIWHEHFSGCECVAQRKQGQRFLNEHPPWDLTPIQTLHLYGKPDRIDRYELVPFLWHGRQAIGLGRIVDDSTARHSRYKLTEMWFYVHKHVVVEFTDNKCDYADACADPCPYMSN
jgi:hypothetical protein